MIGAAQRELPRARPDRPRRQGDSRAWLLLAAAGFAACGDDFDRAELRASHADTQQDGDASSSADGHGCDPGACAALADECHAAACLLGACVVSALPVGAPCDDGDACSALDRCGPGGCIGGVPICPCATAADCSSLDDGDPCTGKLYCDRSATTPTCRVHPATVPLCLGDGDPCHAPTCLPPLGTCGLAAAASGTACDDGAACTTGDTCVGGSCAGGPSQCGCLADPDCASQEDGDLCNGSLFCDKSQFPFACRVNAVTVVSCGGDDDLADCVAPTCAPTTGVCSGAAKPDGHACDDGDPCSKGDTCVAGACKAGGSICPCVADADCLAADDGDPCTGTFYCDLTPGKAGCRLNPATVVACPESASPCIANLCNSAKGACEAVPVPAGVVCEDGMLCTIGDTCDAGTCKPGPNQCSCTKDADCGVFEDGDACNGALICDTSAPPFVCVVNPKSVVTCSNGDGSPCTTPKCHAATGACMAVPLPDGVTCDADGFVCTKVDTCQGGSCVAGTNVCLCTSVADCTTWEDGNLCNGTLVCDNSKVPQEKAVCRVNPASLIVCPAPAPCQAQTCLGATGTCAAVALAQGTACNADNDACTGPDTCVGGTCVAGAPVCACAGDADCAALDDGDACTGVLTCDFSSGKGRCVVAPGSPVSCPAPSKACEQVSCSKGQCTSTKLADGAACDDDKPCTLGDSCLQGNCTSGPNKCGCTTDAHCAPLDDGDLCNGGWHCLNAGQGPGVCEWTAAAVKCSASGLPPCTQPACVPATGACDAIPDLGATGACDDGDACTLGSFCTKGTCGSGKKVACDDNNACTQDSCDGKSGACLHGPWPGPTPCDDGDACTAGDLCADKACAPGKPLSCPVGGDPCAKLTCIAGSCKAAAGGACDDGNPCTADSCDTIEGCAHALLTGKITCGAAGACEAGQCSSIPCTTWSRAWQPPNGSLGASGGLLRALAYKDGWLLVGNVAHAGPPVAWLQVVDAAGKVLSESNVPTTLATIDPIDAVAVSGGALLVGRDNASGKGVAVRWSGSAGAVWTSTPTSMAQGGLLSAIATTAGGPKPTWCSVGVAGAQGNLRIICWDIDKGQTESDEALGGEELAGALPHAIAPGGGPHWWVAGVKGQDGLLAKFLKNGNQVGKAEVMLTDRPLQALAYASAQVLVAVGSWIQTKGGNAIVGPVAIGLDADTAKQLWTWAPPAAGNTTLAHVSAGQDGVIAVGSRALGVEGGAGLVVRLDAAGKLVWRRDLRHREVDGLYGVLATTGGGVAVGVASDAGGPMMGWAVRFDAAGGILCAPPAK